MACIIPKILISPKISVGSDKPKDFYPECYLMACIIYTALIRSVLYSKWAALDWLLEAYYTSIYSLKGAFSFQSLLINLCHIPENPPRLSWISASHYSVPWCFSNKIPHPKTIIKTVNHSHKCLLLTSSSNAMTTNDHIYTTNWLDVLDSLIYIDEPIF